MKAIPVSLILIGMGLWGCQTSNAPSVNEDSESAHGDNMIVWYKLLPRDRMSRRVVPPGGTLIPILKIDGSYYTVCRGIEIPLKECPEGLQWALTPSSMSETTIGFHGPSETCSIRIVDRQRANFDDFYLPDEMPALPMTRVDRPADLPDATAPPPQTLDDFLGWYEPAWLPWVRWEIRKDGQRYWAVEQQYQVVEQPAGWKGRGEPYELIPLPDELGFTGRPGRNPHRFAYNDVRKCFELVLLNSGARMPLARVTPSSGSDAGLPSMMIGIPAWH
jgi:hypothetical protein